MVVWSGTSNGHSHSQTDRHWSELFVDWFVAGLVAKLIWTQLLRKAVLPQKRTTTTKTTNHNITFCSLVHKQDDDEFTDAYGCKEGNDGESKVVELGPIGRHGNSCVTDCGRLHRLQRHENSNRVTSTTRSHGGGLSRPRWDGGRRNLHRYDERCKPRVKR